MRRFPRGGDAVVLLSPWQWAGSLVNVGDIGIIGGMVQENATENVQITFRYSAFNDGEVCSVSGGPGTISTPITELFRMPDQRMVTFWRWKNGIPGSGRGCRYQRMVPVWGWNPSNGEVRRGERFEEIFEDLRGFASMQARY